VIINKLNLDIFCPQTKNLKRKHQLQLVPILAIHGENGGGFVGMEGPSIINLIGDLSGYLGIPPFSL